MSSKSAKKEQIIVTLTSFPAAILYATQAVKSVLKSTVMPDKIVLYLTYSQFAETGIPEELQSIADSNPVFEIRNYDDDIRSYRKLVPALIDFPDAVIITIDDDVWYDKNMLSKLLHLHKQIPDAIFAHRAKRIIVGAPYRKWKKYRWYSFIFKRIHSGFKNIQTGVGGVLYPPHSLKMDMIEPELFKKLAPTTDDIWFWAAAVANGTKIIPVPFGYNKPKGLKKPKELSLKTVNFKSKTDLNRTALETILEEYPIIKQRLAHED